MLGRAARFHGVLFPQIPALATLGAGLVAYKERVLQGLVSLKPCGSYSFQEQRTIPYNPLFFRYTIMKSTIFTVSMTLLFSVFSVSARPQDPFTTTVDSPIFSTT